MNARMGILGRTNKDSRAESRLPFRYTSPLNYALSRPRLDPQQNHQQDTGDRPLRPRSWSHTEACRFCHGRKQAVCPQVPQTNSTGPCRGFRCAEEGRWVLRGIFDLSFGRADVYYCIDAGNMSPPECDMRLCVRILD